MLKDVLFVLLCIPTRISLVVLAQRASVETVKAMGYVALLPVMGFLTLFASDGRSTGAFGQPVWWNALRPVHAALYAVFSILAIAEKPLAWLPLAIDVLLGVIAFVWNRKSR